MRNHSNENELICMKMDGFARRLALTQRHLYETLQVKLISDRKRKKQPVKFIFYILCCLRDVS